MRSRSEIKGSRMSLDVSPALLDAAERGQVSDADFVHGVRTSLPYAWSLIGRAVAGLDGTVAEVAGRRRPAA